MPGRFMDDMSATLAVAEPTPGATALGTPRSARGEGLLRLAFLLGAVADLVVAIDWLLISAGAAVPNLISGYLGAGADYRFAMYIATLFMFGWTAILTWGAARPVERRALLPLTAALLAISVVVDLVAYAGTLGGPHFTIGLLARLLIIGKFTFAYAYSLGAPRGRHP